MDIDQRLRQAYENEDNPPPPPMDPALMASPDDQMLQPALPTARPEPLYGGEPSISNREELTTREKLQRLTEQVGVEYFGLDERNAVDFGKTIWGAGADDVGAPGAVEGLGFADLIGADLIFMLEEGYNRLQRGSVMGDRGDVAQGIAEIGIGAISAIPGGKAAVRVGEQIIRGPVKDFYEEAIERWQAGKSPIPVGMSIEDVTPKTATPVAHSFKAEEGNPNSIINMLYNTEHGGFPTPPDGGRWNKAKLAEYLEKQATEAGTRIEKFDNAAQETISDRIANEAVAALSREGNASDWYNSKIIEMNETLRQLHPELEDGSVNEGVFKLGLALTSNGTTVGDNLKFAEHVYQVFKDTGKFPNDLSSMEAALGGFGKEGPILVKSFQKANVLIDELGVDGFVEFLNTPITVGELKKMGFGVSKENVGFKTHGSIIFGPKIGAGFYQNLRGNFEPVTFDRWWVASWGRWTGNAINKATDKAQAKQLDRFATAIGKKYDNPEDAINEAHQIFAEYKKNNFQPRTELNKAAQRLSEGATITMREEPGAGGDRAFMRATVQRAVEKLRELGYNVTPADLQATVWYPEKELHGALGIGNGRSAPDDYAAAARRLVEERNAGN